MHHPPSHFLDKLRNDSADVAVRAFIVQKRGQVVITTDNHSQSNINANYASVTEQSGILAGEDRPVVLI